MGTHTRLIRKSWLTTACLSLSMGLGACSKNDQLSYFPLTEGSRWVYKLTTEKEDTIENNVQTISVLRESSFDDKPVFIRRSETPENVGIEYWLRADETGIKRIAERMDLQQQAVLDEKPRQVLKFPLQAGATWTSSTVPYALMRSNDYPREMKYVKSILMNYSVEDMEAKVSVPAGEFSQCALVVGKADLTLYTDPLNGFQKIPLTTKEWYCPKVGLVKLERVEELKSTFYKGGRIEMLLVDYSVN